MTRLLQVAVVAMMTFALMVIVVPTAATAFTPTGGQAVEKPNSVVAPQWQPVETGRSNSIWKAYVQFGPATQWSDFLREFVEYNRDKFPATIAHDSDLHLRPDEIYIVPDAAVATAPQLSPEQQQLLTEVRAMVETLLDEIFTDFDLDPDSLAELRHQLADVMTRTDAEAVVTQVLSEMDIEESVRLQTMGVVSKHFGSFEQEMLNSLEEVWQAIAELHSAVDGLSATVADKVDVATFDALLARVNAGEVLNQSQFDSLLRRFIDEQDNLSLVAIGELRKVAQEVFEDRLTVMEAEQLRFDREIQAVGEQVREIHTAQRSQAQVLDKQSNRLAYHDQRFDDVEARVSTLEEGLENDRSSAQFIAPLTGNDGPFGGSESAWYHSIWVVVAALCAALVALFGLAVLWRYVKQVDDSTQSVTNTVLPMEKDIGSIKDRLTNVEKQSGLLLELDAGDRFNNPNLTQESVRELKPDGSSMLLKVKCRDGRIRHVQVTRGVGGDNRPRLKLFGLKEGYDFVDKVDLTALLRHIKKAVQHDWIIGLQEARVAA